MVYFQHPTDYSIEGEILLQLGTVHIVIILSDQIVVIPDGDKIESLYFFMGAKSIYQKSSLLIFPSNSNPTKAEWEEGGFGKFW